MPRRKAYCRMGESDGNRYECPVCSSEFYLKKEMLSHFDGEHTDKEQMSGVIKQKETLYDLSPSAKTTRCRVCTKEFEYKCGASYHMRYEHTNEEIKSALSKEINRIHEYLGHVPTSKDIRTLNTPSYGIYKSIFGSWANALESAGYEAIRRRRNPNKTQIIDEINRLNEELGRPPKQKEFMKNSIYSKYSIYSKFDSWNNALLECGLKPVLQSNGERVKLNYGPNWNELRQIIINRDNNRCKVSGKTIDEISTNWFNVHHITPAREFGAHDPDVDTDYDEMNHPSNLITLSPSIHGRVEGKFTDCDPDEFARRAQEMLDISTGSNKQLSKVACD